MKQAEEKTKRLRSLFIFSSVIALLLVVIAILGYVWKDARSRVETTATEMAGRFVADAAVAAERGEFARALWSTVLALEQRPSPSLDMRLAYYANTGPHLEEIVQHGGNQNDSLRFAAFLPKRSPFAILTAGADGKLRFWDRPVGEDSLKKLADGDNGEPISTIVFSSGGDYALTTGQGHVARLWDTQTGTLLARLDAHKDKLTSASFGLHGSKVITASYDKTARIWDCPSGRLLQTFDHPDVVLGADLSPDGELAVTGCQDGYARLWRVESGTIEHVYFHPDQVTQVRFAPNGKSFLTVIAKTSGDHSVRFWHTAPNEREEPRLLHHNAHVTYARFNSSGTKIVTADRNGNIGIWETKGSECPVESIAGGANVNQVRFSHDGRRLAAALANGKALIYELSDINHPRILRHPRQVQDVCFSADDRRVLTACSDGTARIWQLATSSWVEAPTWVTKGGFDSKGKRFVGVNDDDGNAMAWKLESATGRWKRDAGFPVDDTSRFFDIAYGGKQGEYIVGLCRKDRVVRIWRNTPDGELAFEPVSVNDPVFAFAISPTGAQLATATANGIRMWDLTKTENIHFITMDPRKAIKVNKLD